MTFVRGAAKLLLPGRDKVGMREINFVADSRTPNPLTLPSLRRAEGK